MIIYNIGPEIRFWVIDIFGHIVHTRRTICVNLFGLVFKSFHFDKTSAQLAISPSLYDRSNSPLPDNKGSSSSLSSGPGGTKKQDKKNFIIDIKK